MGSSWLGYFYMVDYCIVNAYEACDLKNAFPKSQWVFEKRSFREVFFCDLISKKP